MKVFIVAGTRPEFIKAFPILKALEGEGHSVFWIHTGQHYSDTLNRSISEDLGLPRPLENIEMGKTSGIFQLDYAIGQVYRICKSLNPDTVLVIGDTNSALAGARAAIRSGIPLIHVEAGLRSGDIAMVEERNRIEIDRVSDLLFVTEYPAYWNLINENLTADRSIVLVGNVIADTVKFFWEKQSTHRRIHKLCKQVDSLRGKCSSYCLATIHRAENVDNNNILESLIKALQFVAEHIPVILIAHPHFQKSVGRFFLNDTLNRSKVEVIPPCSYRDFLALLNSARLVITDSGGIQEESTLLRVPCLTIRRSTERPITTLVGSNRVVGTDPLNIYLEVRNLLCKPRRLGNIPPYWDGNTAKRIASFLNSWRPPKYKNKPDHYPHGGVDCASGGGFKSS